LDQWVWPWSNLECTGTDCGGCGDPPHADAACTGAIGSGTGILLAVTTIYQCYESVAKESTDGALAFFN
jgi:hypothetical protein